MSFLLAWDCETTGLSPEWHRIIQIAAASKHPGRNGYRTFDQFVSSVKTVPRKITQLTGIRTTDIEKHGIPFHQALVDFVAFLRTSRCIVLAGYNHGFDWRFLVAMCQREGLVVPSVNVVDVLTLVRERFRGIRAEQDKPKSFKLVDVYEFFFHTPLTQAHNASADAVATLRVADAFTRQAISNRVLYSATLVQGIQKKKESIIAFEKGEFKCRTCTARHSKYFAHTCTTHTNTNTPV
jgi:DNA polymerase III epsilon subunit-like protein